ncbi:hypothetical protein DSECCO2_662170 [anaerobic digester metagenome]
MIPGSTVNTVCNVTSVATAFGVISVAETKVNAISGYRDYRRLKNCTGISCWIYHPGCTCSAVGSPCPVVGSITCTRSIGCPAFEIRIECISKCHCTGRRNIINSSVIQNRSCVRSSGSKKCCKGRICKPLNGIDTGCSQCCSGAIRNCVIGNYHYSR